MSIGGGLILGALLCPLCLGIALMRRELTRARRDLAGLQQWADDIADWIEEQFGGPLPLAITDDPQPDPEPAEAGGPDTVIAHPASSQVRRTELLRARPSPGGEPDLSRFSFDPDGRRHG